jgi:hypothetical protein
MAAIRATLPVRFVWDANARRYVRTHRRLRTATLYQRNRRALRAIVAGESYFYDSQDRENQTLDTLRTLISRLADQAMGPGGYDGHTTDAYRATYSAIVPRLNKAAGADHFFLCGDCTARIVTTLERRNPEGRHICGDCADAYVSCAVCEVGIRADNALQNHHGQWVCETHWTEDNSTTGELASYSTDITLRKRGFLSIAGERAPLWLGWELEVHPREESAGGDDDCCEDCSEHDDDGDATGECTNSECSCHASENGNVVQRVQESAGAWAIAKSDGSLRGQGFEIVSVPASLAWHAATVKPWLERAKDYLSGWPHDDCGMHVHVGRKQLSELTQGKLLTFMQDPTNQSFITDLAGRDVNSYCQRGTKKKVPDYRREASCGRYQALNFNTRGKKTIEFRVFRSNVAPAGFIKNLEFVHAVCSWCRIASLQEVAPAQRGIRNAARGDAVKNFIRYVQRNRATYPHLVRWFEARDYLPKPRRHPDAPACTVLQSIAA